MFVEGTLRWQVTEDCPWDLLMALAIRDLGGIVDACDPLIPRAVPTVSHVAANASLMKRILVHHATEPDMEALRSQWRAWWERILVRETRPAGTQLKPPHFTIFDRELELQDLVAEHYVDALAWTEQRHDEYVLMSEEQHAKRVADIVEVVHEREYDLRRQASYFRLDIYVLPLARPGAWIVAPHTVIVSTSLRQDSPAFRAWFTPVVAALV